MEPGREGKPGPAYTGCRRSEARTLRAREHAAESLG
jgi:hypothetical protein